MSPREKILETAIERIAIRASHLMEMHPEEKEFETFYNIAHTAYYSKESKTDWFVIFAIIVYFIVMCLCLFRVI